MAIIDPHSGVGALNHLTALVAGCPTTEQPPVENELTGWLGAAPHIAIQGKLDGEDLDLRLEGDAAADASKVFCTREYVADDDGTGAADLTSARNTEFKINGPLTVDGEERIVELEFKKHDFQNATPDEEIEVVVRDDTQDPGADQMWVELEWHLAVDDSDLFESAASGGSFVFGQFTGTPGEGGVVIPENEGAAGGYAEVAWGVDEELKISASAPCTVNAIEVETP